MGQYAYPNNVNFTNGLDGMFVYLNTVTSNWFANLLLIAVYILFATGFYFSRKDMFGAFAVGGFATFVFSIFLWVGGMISGITFSFVVAVAIISFASLWLNEGR